jgi:hypothetical protein
MISSLLFYSNERNKPYITYLFYIYILCYCFIYYVAHQLYLWPEIANTFVINNRPRLT